MTQALSVEPASILDQKLAVQPIGVDDFSSVRYLHATAMRTQTLDALSEEELASFLRLVASPAYMDVLAKETLYCGWIDGELVGTVSWHPGGANGSTATIGGIFVLHPRLGIGRRMLAAAEADVRKGGFERLSACATANALPFFLGLGYEMATRGVRQLSYDCVLPVTFVRKRLPPLRSTLN
jgi:GNAT superfamily N-acetyltransferase